MAGGKRIIYVIAVYSSNCGLVRGKGNEYGKRKNPAAFLPKPIDDEWSRFLAGEWEWSFGGQGISERITEKIDDNKLIVTERYSLADGSKMEDKRYMTRRIETDK